MLTDSSESAKRFITSPIVDPEDLDLSDEDEEGEDICDLIFDCEDDDDFIDDEEFYDLCPNSLSARL